MLYLLGENSFLCKNLYILLKKKYNNNIILLSHHEIDQLSEIKDEDILINFCGVNRAEKENEYIEGNFLLAKNIVNNIKNKPFFIHVSSLMVYGFKNKNVEDLVNYQKWFIKSKLLCEEYLCNNYDNNNLSIIRPSNIYGYNTVPYYNNILSTLVYEKINNLTKINNINSNCIRNMLCVNNFSNKVLEIIETKKNGIYNILSNNNSNLKTIVETIYDNNTPSHINFNNGEEDILDLDNSNINGENIIINEDLNYEITKLEENMRVFLKLKNEVSIKKLNTLSDNIGNIVEISNLESKRLYKITLNKNVIRGNHFHYKQIEEFYTNKGYVIYMLAYSENPEIIYLFKSYENDLIRINPNIIHTLINDYNNNISEIIIGSTQEFIENIIPDTKYIKLTL